MPVTAKLSRKFYETLGDDVANELVEWFNRVDATYRLELREMNDLNFARFDAKVGERFAEFQAHVDRRFAEFQTQVDRRFADVDRRFSELDGTLERRFGHLETLLERRLGEAKAELIRWTFAFWVGTALAVVGLKALLVFALVALVLGAQDPGALRSRIEARIAQAPATAVGVYYRDLTTRDSVLVGARRRFHAASTMKVPVMIQLFRDRDAHRLALDDSIPVTNTFRSIVDSSTYELDKADDSDSTLYARVGGKASIRELVELMETVSSNLATNILITRIGARRANATAHRLGADSILVLRGVEDGKAYRAGRNNTTTARDLGVLMAAIAENRAASPAACREMLGILGRQHFKEGIPAGVPDRVRVYHKTGWVGKVVYHDAAIVELSGGRRYVLVVLTGGIEKTEDAHTLVSDISQIVYEEIARR